MKSKIIKIVVCLFFMVVGNVLLVDRLFDCLNSSNNLVFISGAFCLPLLGICDIMFLSTVLERHNKREEKNEVKQGN